MGNHGNVTAEKPKFDRRHMFQQINQDESPCLSACCTSKCLYIILLYFFWLKHRQGEASFQTLDFSEVFDSMIRIFQAYLGYIFPMVPHLDSLCPCHVSSPRVVKIHWPKGEEEEPHLGKKVKMYPPHPSASLTFWYGKWMNMTHLYNVYVSIYMWLTDRTYAIFYSCVTSRLPKGKKEPST
jgi:hypothetical protein